MCNFDWDKQITLHKYANIMNNKVYDIFYLIVLFIAHRKSNIKEENINVYIIKMSTVAYSL